LGAVYPLASATATVVINVSGGNPDTNGNGILDVWEIGKFGNADPGANPAAADPDGDGLSNLMEYALDTDPLGANPNPILHVLEPIANGRHLRITVSKNPLATNLVYSVETCGSLDDWSAANTVIETNTDTQLIVRDSVGISASSRRFIRLRVQTVPRPQ
jgi:hypothetical protein